VKPVTPFLVLLSLLAVARVSGGQTVLKEREIDVKGKHWSIAVYDEGKTGRGIAFYRSKDLKQWTRTGKLDGFFECPEIFRATGKTLAAGESIKFVTTRQTADILLTVRPSPGATTLILNIGGTKIGYDFKTGKTLPLPGGKKEKKGAAAPVALQDGKLKIRVVVDRSMVEIFYNKGEVYGLLKRNTPRIGPITLRTEGTVEDFRVYGMKPIW